MSRRPQLNVSEAAEYLYAVLEEMKPQTETAVLARRRALVLLDVCVDQGCKAVEADVKAKGPNAYHG